MDYNEKSLDSAPTMGPGRTRNGGAGRPAEPFEEHSIGSAPTMGGRTTPPGGRFRPGDVLLGRYTVLAELGEGGMGVVYKCLDNIGGIEVAIKCLPPELSRNESEMEGIRENYAIVARLHHSAISGLRQLEKDPEFGEYYLVMDLAKGEDLSTILRKRRGAPMPLDEALAILRPLASALDYAHGEHVLHRDVKPGNVKVETLPPEASRPLTKEEVRSTKDEGTGWGERPTDQLATDQLITGGRAASPRVRVQLLDFGLAAEVRSSMSRVSLRGHAGSSGTPAYMAPEQWEARRQSAATDQYSLAVMAYQMLAGYRPFDTDNMELLKSAVLTRAPEEIEGLPAHVNAALQKALAKNPKDRFASCTEFVEAISNAEPQSAQRDFHTEAQRHGESISGAAKPVTRIPNSASTPPISEADVLRRKLALTRALKAISAEDRADNEFAMLVAKAEDELAVAEEACKFGRFGAADESLNAAEMALDDLKKARQAREEAERKAKEESERKAREERERCRGNKIRPGELKTVIINPRVSMNLRWCPATTSEYWKAISGGEDSFWMGSPENESGRSHDEVRHAVKLTTGFWMGETPVTQLQWDSIMGGNPSKFLDGKNFFGFGGVTSPQRPVESVSKTDCLVFLKVMNELSPQSGFLWVLPTEAQWEYACRAGTTGAYGGTGKLSDMGWYASNNEGYTRFVGQKKPNDWGLYDMHGNVWEWCHDLYGEYASHAVTDPTGEASGFFCVLRGGSFLENPQDCRSASRKKGSDNWHFTYGFRIALVPVK